MATLLQILQTPPELIKRAEASDAFSQWVDDHPLLVDMLVGGGIGAMGGAAIADKGQGLRNAAIGGLLGAGAGAGYYALSNRAPEEPPPPAPGSPEEFWTATKKVNEAKKPVPITRGNYEDAVTYLKNTDWSDHPEWIREYRSRNLNPEALKELSAFTPYLKFDPKYLKQGSDKWNSTYLARTLRSGTKAPVSKDLEYTDTDDYVPYVTGSKEVDRVYAAFAALPKPIQKQILAESSADTMEDLYHEAEELKKRDDEAHGRIPWWQFW